MAGQIFCCYQMIKGKKNRTGVPGMIGILIFGIMLAVWGMCAVVKGKLPFISRYHNVEKVPAMPVLKEKLYCALVLP